MHDIKDSFEKHNHLEQIERCEKITWTYKDGNIIHSDSWNERHSKTWRTDPFCPFCFAPHSACQTDALQSSLQFIGMNLMGIG
jgi:hypothetical protein